MVFGRGTDSIFIDAYKLSKWDPADVLGFMPLNSLRAFRVRDFVNGAGVVGSAL